MTSYDQVPFVLRVKSSYPPIHLLYGKLESKLCYEGSEGSNPPILQPAANLLHGPSGFYSTLDSCTVSYSKTQYVVYTNYTRAHYCSSRAAYSVFCSQV